MTIAVDWDSTLVDQDQEWLPGALDALRQLSRQKHRLVIHSARACYPQGVQAIEAKLAQHHVKARVFPKPPADLYIDDKALPFAGSWPAVLRAVRDAKA